MPLGTFKGRGSWGVSTLRLNPISQEPYVRLFETESEAVQYARTRTYRSGQAYFHRPFATKKTKADPREARPNPKAKTYFVVQVFNRQISEPYVYRVLRGYLGGTRVSKQGYVERRAAVMVFNANGKLNKSLTIEIEE
jgi:hypothetical protein